MNAKELSEALKALAVPSRLKIMELLSTRSYCVNALTARLGISQPAVSQHLAVLKRAGLVDTSKAGTKVHYRVNVGRFERILEALGTVGAAGDGANRSRVFHSTATVAHEKNFSTREGADAANE